MFPWWPFVFSMLLVALGLLDTVSQVTAECLHVALAPFSGGFPFFFFFNLINFNLINLSFTAPFPGSLVLQKPSQASQHSSQSTVLQ